MGSSGAVSARERVMRALDDEQASPLYNYVVRLLGGDLHRAEDVVQETLLRCWRTQDVGGSEPLRGWLFRVARNMVVDRILSSMILKDAMQGLSPKHREVLYETYYSWQVDARGGPRARRPAGHRQVAPAPCSAGAAHGPAEPAW